MRVLSAQGVPFRHGIAKTRTDPGHAGFDPIERVMRQRDRRARSGQAMHPRQRIEHEGVPVEVPGQVAGLTCVVDGEYPASAAVRPVVGLHHRRIGPLGHCRTVEPSEQARLREGCDLAGLHHQAVTRLRERRTVEAEPFMESDRAACRTHASTIGETPYRSATTAPVRPLRPPKRRRSCAALGLRHESGRRLSFDDRHQDHFTATRLHDVGADDLLLAVVGSLDEDIRQ